VEAAPWQEYVPTISNGKGGAGGRTPISGLIESRRCLPRCEASGVPPDLRSNSVVSRSLSESRRARKLELSLAGAAAGALAFGDACFLQRSVGQRGEAC